MQTNKQSVIVDQHGNPLSITQPSTEVGFRATDDSRLRALYNTMSADPDLVSKIRDIRLMDARDGRVKKIHGRTSRAMTKSGLKLDNRSGEKKIDDLFKNFVQRLGLSNREKLASDARGLIMEGNLPLQWAIHGKDVVAGIRMPTDTLRARVAENGQFKNKNNAYEQWDGLTGDIKCTFAEWQLTVGRLTPDNIDDMGSLGRPYLDATRETWRKLIRTEEDMVIRRHDRSFMRIHHNLEGAQDHELEKYEEDSIRRKNDNTTDYYTNKKGAITAIQGDATLSEIADVVYLLDTFFSGSPAPKGLFGYQDDLSRDVLEDLKRDFFDELDALQDSGSWVYEQGFRLDLLLKGINPDAYDFTVMFRERVTTTANQKMDLGLKAMSLDASHQSSLEMAGFDFETEKRRKKKEAKDSPFNVYPSPNQITPKPRVTAVTEGNAKKNESATSVSN